MLSSSGKALWRRVVVEGRSEVCMGRVCFDFLTRGGAMAADCVHGGLAYIGVSVGGTNHGAITPTPRKTERACFGNAIEPPLRMRWEDGARAPAFVNRREQRGRGVNAASLRGELKGHDQSKDDVSSWRLLGKQQLFNLHGNCVTSVAGELKGLRAKQGLIFTQRNKFLQTLRNQVIAQWFVRCSETCRLRFESGMQHIFLHFLSIYIPSFLIYKFFSPNFFANLGLYNSIIYFLKS